MVPHSVIGLCSETNKQSSSRLVIPPTATHAESTELAANKHTETTKKRRRERDSKGKVEGTPRQLDGRGPVRARRSVCAKVNGGYGKRNWEGGEQLHRKDADGDIIALWFPSNPSARFVFLTTSHHREKICNRLCFEVDSSDNVSHSGFAHPEPRPRNHSDQLQLGGWVCESNHGAWSLAINAVLRRRRLFFPLPFASLFFTQLTCFVRLQ